MDRTSIIVAVGSPPGRSRRGLIRASGPGALELLDAMLTAPWMDGDPRPMAERSAARSVAVPAPRGVARVRLRVPAPGIAALAIRTPGPHTATGEDAFEVLLPGNPNLLDLVIESMLALDSRARRAGPGEFTARAFLNGRISLDEAEGIAAIIRATSDAELDAAARLADGALGGACREWSSRVAECAALLEAGIDFTDEEDVTAIAPERLAAEMARVADAIEAVGRGGGAGSRSRESLPRVVLAGMPNAGKSTLFNALLGMRRTVESPVAGTTRDAIEARWRIAGAEAADARAAPAAGRAGPSIEVLLVDLPGVEPNGGADAAVAPEAPSASAASAAPGAPGAPGGPDAPNVSARMAAAARRAVAEADLVLVCVDSAQQEPPAFVIDACGGRPRIIVRTKVDRRTPAEGGVPVSAHAGTGLDELARRVARALGAAATAHGASMEVIPRHRDALDRAAAALREAIGRARHERSLGPWKAPEETAALLRLALDALGEITGATHSDELLDLVFSRFCIGK